MKSTKSHRLYAILELTETSGTVSRGFNIFMMSLILLNVLSVILETVPEFAATYSSQLLWFEVISILIFSVEYLCRLWVCTQSPKFQGAVIGRLRYMISPMALVDLLAIVPFYIPLLIPFDLRIIRSLRLFRVFRLLKLGRHDESLKTLAEVMREKRSELLVTITAVTVLLVLSATAMYYIEGTAQPKAFPSIPAAMWWGVVTLTTVGYGDIYPITALGKFIGALIALLGVGLFALPAGIFASGFSERLKRRRQIMCPHCGRQIDH